MAFFLFKPHVDGPKGITSPDLIVDYLLVDGVATPVSQLTMALELQVVAKGEHYPACALVAAGAGPLLSPALVLADGHVGIGRYAWRLAMIAAHAAGDYLE